MSELKLRPLRCIYEKTSSGRVLRAARIPVKSVKTRNTSIGKCWRDCEGSAALEFGDMDFRRDGSGFVDNASGRVGGSANDSAGASVGGAQVAGILGGVRGVAGEREDGCGYVLHQC